MSTEYEIERAAAEERLCSDMDEFGNWVAWQQSSERKPSMYFGPISSKELVVMLLDPCATVQQVDAARIELRTRYLQHFAKHVEREAAEAA